AAGGSGRSRTVRRPDGALPPPAAAHGRLAARPSASQPHRPLRRDPGDVPGGLGPAGGIRTKANDAVLPVAALPGGPEVGDVASASPGETDASCRPRGRPLPGPAARGELGRPGR